MTPKAFVQVAYVVKDVRQTAQAWVATFGAGPFFLTPRTDLGYILCGRPARVEASGALGQYGDLQIELIQQYCDRASLYRDTIASGSEGLHHMACVVEDLEAAIRRYEEDGCATAARMTVGGVRVAHMDAVERFGHMIELMQDSADIRRLLALTRDAAMGWAGEEPLREISQAALTG